MPSDDQLLSDLQRTDQAIKTAVGSSPRLFCPADANFTDLQCDTVNKQFGYTVIYWGRGFTRPQRQGGGGHDQHHRFADKAGLDHHVVGHQCEFRGGVAAGDRYHAHQQGLQIRDRPRAHRLGLRQETADTRTITSSTAPASTPSTSAGTPAPVTTSTSGYHPFGVQSPGGSSGASVPDRCPQLAGAVRRKEVGSLVDPSGASCEVAVCGWTAPIENPPHNESALLLWLLALALFITVWLYPVSLMAARARRALFYFVWYGSD